MNGTSFHVLSIVNATHEALPVVLSGGMKLEDNANEL
jgi:hypothetical protein